MTKQAVNIHLQHIADQHFIIQAVNGVGGMPNPVALGFVQPEFIACHALFVVKYGFSANKGFFNFPTGLGVIVFIWRELAVFLAMGARWLSCLNAESFWPEGFAPSAVWSSPSISFPVINLRNRSNKAAPIYPIWMFC